MKAKLKLSEYLDYKGPKTDDIVLLTFASVVVKTQYGLINISKKGYGVTMTFQAMFANCVKNTKPIVIDKAIKRLDQIFGEGFFDLDKENIIVIEDKVNDKTVCTLLKKVDDGYMSINYLAD